jgi:hypothetical protein
MESFAMRHLRPLILALLASQAGCATIADHPYITATVVALAAGSIAASQHHDYRTSAVAAPPGTASIGTPNCNTGACQ